MAWLSCFDVVPVFAPPRAGWEASSADMSGAAEGQVTPWGSACARRNTAGMERTVIAFLKHWLHLLSQSSLAVSHRFSSTYHTLQSTLPVPSNEPVNIIFLLSLDDLITD